MRVGPRPSLSDVDPFRRRTVVDGECWLWTGATTHNGYGSAWHAGKGVRAHRLAWQLTHGPVARGKFVLHRCDRRQCVNPDHLFLGSAADNSKDMVAKRRQAAGSRNARAVLGEADVAWIRARVGAGEARAVVARALGVSRSTVSEIASRKIWRHIP